MLETARDAFRWLAPVERWSALATWMMVLVTVILGIGVLAGGFRVKESPYAVVKKFYEAGSAGDGPAALAYLSEAGRKHFGGSASAWQESLASLTADGPVSEVQVLRAELGDDEGEVAWILVMLLAEDETVLDVRSETLVQERGEWKLACPGDLDCPWLEPGLQRDEENRPPGLDSRTFRTVR